MNSKTLSIAMAQILSVDGDRRGNLLRIRDATAKAKQRGANLVVFPESCVLGWLNPDAHDQAYPIPGQDASEICRIAEENNIHICVGLDEKKNTSLYGSAILVSDKGVIELRHRKLNVLPHLMTPPYSAGADIQVVETSLGRIGILICADSFIDEYLDRMRDLRPEILLIPYGWAAEADQWPQHGLALEKVVIHAAKRVGCAVVGVNSIGEITHGPWQGRTYGGQSVAVDVHGNIIAKGADRENGVFLLDIQTA